MLTTRPHQVLSIGLFGVQLFDSEDGQVPKAPGLPNDTGFPNRRLPSPTDAVDEYAGQDEVEDVEHGPPPQPDRVRDVRVGLRAAAVVLHVPFGAEVHQVKLAVRLVVGEVAFRGLADNIHLRNGGSSTCCSYYLMHMSFGKLVLHCERVCMCS